MRIHTSDRIIAYITLLSGLTISAVAIYYSVAGLMAIFAAAVIPIVVMGVALEISKLAATVWLKQNWNKAPTFIKGYLLAAIAILMVITSMGIFGFLSKAHSDQSLIGGDIQSRIAVYDEKIKTAKDNIDANRKALKQLDEAVDQVMGRSTDEKGADKAVAIRRGQAKERARLLQEITAEQKVIAKLNEERAPIAAEVRKIEAEVGPIKYIAKFIYGDSTDTNLLEKAVTWVIIIIVIVFDPLAVILLLASQYSFMWFREQREKAEIATEGDSPEKESDVVSTDTVTEQKENSPEDQPSETYVINETTHPYLYKPFKHFENLKPMVWKEPEPEKEDLEEVDEEQKELDLAHETEKQAMVAWKHDHPESSLKAQRRLYERGIIKELPWMEYLKPEADFNDAVDEAKKWADENPQTVEAEEAKQWANERSLNERPGDYLPESYMENVEGKQIKKPIEGYQQNAEQNESTLWQRVQQAKK